MPAPLKAPPKKIALKRFYNVSIPLSLYELLEAERKRRGPITREGVTVQMIECFLKKVAK